MFAYARGQTSLIAANITWSTGTSEFICEEIFLSNRKVLLTFNLTEVAKKEATKHKGSKCKHKEEFYDWTGLWLEKVKQEPYLFSVIWAVTIKIRRIPIGNQYV